MTLAGKLQVAGSKLQLCVIETTAIRARYIKLSRVEHPSAVAVGKNLPIPSTWTWYSDMGR